MGITGEEGNTYVVDVSSGNLVGVVEWVYTQGGLGELGGPDWVSENKFIINGRDDGPQLVMLGEAGIDQVQPIAPAFFDQASQPQYRAYGTAVAGSGTFHLLLIGATTPNDGLPHLLLYHSENDSMEEIPVQFDNLWSFGPDGRYLALHDRRSVEGYERTEVWLRPIDPPGSEPRLFVTINDESYPAWSVDWSVVAIATDVERTPASIVTAYTIPDGTMRGQWSLGNYRSGLVRWSPDNAYLAAVGSAPNVGEKALFILPRDR